MSKDEIYEIAQRDTPPEIHVPNTWPALIVWAAGKFGVGFLIAMAVGYAAMQIYQDGREREAAFERLNEKVLIAFQNSATANTEVAAALREHTRIIERLQSRLEQPR